MLAIECYKFLNAHAWHVLLYNLDFNMISYILGVESIYIFNIINFSEGSQMYSINDIVSYYYVK